MKKITLILFIQCLIISCSKKENIKKGDDWKFYELNGDVKSITTKTYILNQNDTTKKTIETNLEQSFDKNSNLILERTWLNTGKLVDEKSFFNRNQVIRHQQFFSETSTLSTTYKWDSLANNIESRQVDQTGKQLHKVAQSFNKKMMKEKKTYHFDDLAKDKVGYIYDKKGNLIEEDFYLNMKAIQYKTLFQYDESNHKIGETRLDKDNLITYKASYKYVDDQLTETNYFDSKGILQYKQLNKYYEKNLTAVETSDLALKENTIDLYEYNDEKQKTSYTHILNGTVTDRYTYQYNKNNNLIAMNRNDGSEQNLKEYTYKYNYDKKGNWTKKVAFENNIPISSTERKIQYF